MPDDQNTTQNPISGENPIPPSPQEPMADIPINTTGSETSNVPLEAPETPINTDVPVSLNNDNPENSPVSTQNAEEPKTAESGSVEAENPKVEPISEPAQVPEIQKAQMAGNEPFEDTQDKPLSEVEDEPVSVSSSGEVKAEPEKIIPVAVVVSNKNKILELLAKAKNAIQFRKRKKLDKVMALFLKQSKITNDDVEKFLHISDATATRYLSQLEKENKIKQVGKTGHAVSYSRI